MNNSPSLSFATVFFLVVLFIGMGLLAYHTYEVSIENGQLKEAVGTLQATVSTQNTEISALTAANTQLKSENDALVEENSELKSEMDKAVAENAAMKSSNPGPPAELDVVEYVAYPESGSNAAPQALHSTVLPSDLEFWMKVASVFLLQVILVLSYTFVKLLKDTLRERTTALNRRPVERGSSRRRRNNHVVDSRFLDR